jgi:prepilin-type processing-associated H-X9-DG protein
MDGSDGLRIGDQDDAKDPLTILYPHPADRGNLLFLDGHASVLIDVEVPAQEAHRFWKPRELVTEE